MKTTATVRKLLESTTKMELSKKIGICRMTLDSRLRNHNWKRSEIFVIEYLKNI